MATKISIDRSKPRYKTGAINESIQKVGGALGGAIKGAVEGGVKGFNNPPGAPPRDRAKDPARSTGSGSSMITPAPSIPKKDLDPNFKKVMPLPKNNNVDPKFGRKTMPAPKNYGGIQAQPMPYYPGEGGGGIKTMPYTPPADGSGPKFENMPFKPESPKLKPAKPAPQEKLKPSKPFTPPSKKMGRGKP